MFLQCYYELLKLPGPCYLLVEHLKFNKNYNATMFICNNLSLESVKYKIRGESVNEWL